MKAILHKSAVAAKAAAIVCACLLLTVFSDIAAQGAKKGIQLCLSVLVPSLFPFMALSSYTVRSGLCSKLSRPLEGFSRLMFGLGGEFVPVIIMGLIGGYPVGAKGIAALFESGEASESEAKAASLFVVCAGPGFVISYIGAALYKNVSVGIIMLCAQIMSVIILGVFSKLFYKSQAPAASVKKPKVRKFSDGSAVVESAYDAAHGILNICVTVVLFSVLTELVSKAVQNNVAENAVYCLLEVCSAVNKLSYSAPIELCAFAVGFGGICVHFQIFSSLGKLKINKALFFLFRIAQGILTALFTRLGLAIFKPEVAVFSSASAMDFDFFNGSILSGAALLGISICFLYTLKYNIKH